MLHTRLKVVFPLLGAFLLVIPFAVLAQTGSNPNVITGADGSNRTITTAVPFLYITPDARAAGMGDAGGATSADANSIHWNPAKLVRIEDHFGFSVSYTPWLGKIINDMSISYLSAYYKITREQAVSFSMRYFDLGEIFLTGPNNEDLGRFNPREFAFDLGYSRLLTENLSIGGTVRYIHSNLIGSFSTGGMEAQPGNSVAVDLGVFYNKPLLTGRDANISLGASITNIGAKISYTDADNRDFLPTNLRLSSAYTTALDPFNAFTFALDFNKLLVPSPFSGRENSSLLSGMFGSFADAPGGFSEEIREITAAMGIEYWYNKMFAARTGYFLEAADKGNRKYLTLGVGVRHNRYGLDVAYLVPQRQEHPLAETVRFTILLNFEHKSQIQDSVID